MRGLLLLALACVPALAVNCNPIDQSGCPAASAPANGVVAGTAWDVATNSATGPNAVTISVLRNQTYGSVSNASESGSNPCGNGFDVYYTTGADSTYPILFMPHAGGLSGGNRNQPFGGTGPTNVILFLQQMWNRKTGIKGGVAVVLDYTLTSGCSSGTAQLAPYQIREMHEALYYIVNDAGSTIPGNRQNMIAIEYSAGAYLGFMAVATKGSNFYTNLGPNTPTNAYTFTAGVFISPWLGWTTAASTYDTFSNTNGAGIFSTESALGSSCTSASTCATVDSSIQGSGLFWITQSNYANLNIPMFFAHGEYDSLIENAAGATGTTVGDITKPMNGQVAKNLLAALSPPIVVVNREYPYNHGAGLINGNGGPQSAVFKDALYFVNNLSLPAAVMQ